MKIGVFSATEPSDNHNFENIGGCGFWDKLSNLLFVEDNEQKQKILKEYLNSTQKVFIEIDDIITILKTTHH